MVIFEGFFVSLNRVFTDKSPFFAGRTYILRVNSGINMDHDPWTYPLLEADFEAPRPFFEGFSTRLDRGITLAGNNSMISTYILGSTMVYMVTHTPLLITSMGGREVNFSALRGQKWPKSWFSHANKIGNNTWEGPIKIRKLVYDVY